MGVGADYDDVIEFSFYSKYAQVLVDRQILVVPLTGKHTPNSRLVDVALPFVILSLAFSYSPVVFKVRKFQE